jgi:hypothetical protein
MFGRSRAVNATMRRSESRVSSNTSTVTLWAGRLYAGVKCTNKLDPS